MMNLILMKELNRDSAIHSKNTNLDLARKINWNFYLKKRMNSKQKSLRDIERLTMMVMEKRVV